jgi:GlpG protein
VDARTANTPRYRQATAPVTFILIGLCVLVAGITRLGQKLDPYGLALMIDDPSSRISHPLSKVQPTPGEDDIEGFPSAQSTPRVQMFDKVRHGQVWRLFTPMLLHFGPTHLLFNMWMLYSIGGLLERRCGMLFFASIILISAALSSVAQYAWSGPGFGGMSGVLYAIFGYVWIRGRSDPSLGFRMSSQTVAIMLGWLVLCMTGALGPIANAAHLAGLVVGAVWASIPLALSELRRQKRRSDWGR